MLAARSMASGGPLDAQRQQRWPVHTSTDGLSVKVPGLNDNREEGVEEEDYGEPNASNLIQEEDTEGGEEVIMLT